LYRFSPFPEPESSGNVDPEKPKLVFEAVRLLLRDIELFATCTGHVDFYFITAIFSVR
jgi:hypothetical protein